ncbi:unnamed protein product [Commensalibacter papalotli (ex Botero et al. 2024)]|uniref:Transposase n=1 Tax=Commensalibacter papalotli (ex Botero et al. 2024) TaxID=2972766 RepID=A0ABM9HLR0_9PROT|nr:unnamed protein product [Commensalibacter papalotli (ex Botero et al. 2024)]CAI3948855.1 unnamed protein product [Commensalibacter papalotli (ex Botero et al. 2024)]
MLTQVYLISIYFKLFTSKKQDFTDFIIFIQNVINDDHRTTLIYFTKQLR